MQPKLCRRQEIRETPRLCLSVLIVLVTLASSSQLTPSTAGVRSPDLDFILQRVEEIQDQAAPSRLYEVTREYKLFHGSDTQPTSEVTAQIDFAHPNIKPYKILQTSGASRGEEMVRELLERETDSSKAGRRSEIRRMNYDSFVFGKKPSVFFLSTC